MAKSRRSRSPRKSPVRIPLTKGSLGEYGYSHISDMSATARRRALSGAIRNEGPLPVFRKLNALYVLNRNRNPEIADIFESDKEWVKYTYID